MLPVAKALKRMQHGQLGHQEDFMLLIPVGQTYPVVYSFEHDLIFLTLFQLPHVIMYIHGFILYY